PPAAGRAPPAARRESRSSSVHFLDEDLDLAAAGQADVPGLLVGDAEAEQSRRAVLDRIDRFLDHRALDAAPRDRALQGAAVVDAELAADRPRPGAPGGDHGRDAN